MQPNTSTRRQLAALVTASVLCLTLGVVGAPTAAAATAAMPSDFNGDGYADLAIGVPGENREAGAVNVLYGSAMGLTAAGDQSWTQDSPGVRGVSVGRTTYGEPDRFGASFASGDFDRDGFADLAVAVPGDATAPLNEPVGDDVDVSGAVNVLYGSPTGLTSAGDQLWTRSALSQFGQAWDNIAAGVASGDFDGDGYADLAVSGRYYARNGDLVPMTLGGTVLYGGPGGLSTARAHPLIFTTDAPTVAYRHSFAAGDIDGDGRDELAVGDRFATVGGISDAGDVRLFYGTPDGLSGSNRETWTLDGSGTTEQAEAGDGFGASLAIGDFDADEFGDLAIGAPWEDLAVTDVGVVVILRGSSTGLTADKSQLWHQDVAGVPDANEAKDHFGNSLAAGDFDGDGADDLAIGVVGEDPVGSTIGEWGGVVTLYGGAMGLTATGSQAWTQSSPGVPNSMEKSDFFAAALSSANYGRSGAADLAIGVPYENIGGVVNAGMVNVLYGRATGLSATNAQGWWQNSSGVRGTAERNDLYGSALTP